MICNPFIDQNDLAACNCPTAPGPTVDLAIDVASEILYALTGRQYPGTCEATLRPCAAPGPIAGFNWWSWNFPWYPIRIGGQWLNIGPCGCHMANDCACKPYPRLNLGRADIQSVTEVLIDGVVLDPGSYRLDENRYLVRTDGSHWPCCQDLALDSGPGTWSVEVVYGWPIPESLKRATAILATEYVKACINDDSCRLPARTQSVAKQGITIEMQDPQIFLDQGRTGVYEVDLIIKSLNPQGIAREALVRSVEVRSAGVWS